MKVRTMILALAVLALAFGSAAASEQWIPFESRAPRDVSVSVVSSSLTGVGLRIGVPGAFAEDVSTRGGEFVRLTLPSYGYSTTVGEALTPTVRELIEIPRGADPVLRVVSAEFRSASLASLGLAHPLVPVQHPVEKVPGALESADFVMSSDFYSRNAFEPTDVARLGEVRTLRGHRYVQLEVNPVRYNPATGELEFATSVEIEIDFIGGDAEATRRAIDRYSTGSFDRLAHDLFVNHDAFLSRYDIPLPIIYLIVTHDDFYDEILPLAAWKDQKGHETVIVKTSEIPGGSTKENIKAYIQDAYDNWPAPPTFVLLVGDTGYVPYWVGTQSSSPTTDLYYVTMDGAADWDPDIWIGRFSCTTGAQVTNLVNKTVDYERYDLTSGTDWIKKAVFMASQDNYTVSEGTHNYVIRQWLDPAGYYSQKLYSATYNATTQQVRDAFNDGRSLGIYSGHGSITSWGDGPPFSASDVNGLTNYDKLPLIHSYSCLTGQFSTACFGETWINATDKGALVFWGSSVTSYWDQDDILEKAAFEAAFVEGYTWACGISHRALYHLYQYYGGGGSTHRYFEMYNILGDPGVEIWTDVPATLDASYPGQIPAGSSSFSLSVTSGGSPVETALVCLVKADEGIYGTAYTNAMGQATVALDPAPVVPGELDVTITRRDHYPHEGSTTVSLANEPYCLYHSHEIDDDDSGDSTGNGNGQVEAGEEIELLVTLENVGLDVGYGISATIATADPFVTLIDGYEEYGDITASGGTAQCLEDYDFAVDGACPDGHVLQFTLTATDGNGIWESACNILVHAPVLAVDGMVVEDFPGGNGNGCAEAGETVTLSVALENTGSAVAAGVTGELTTTDPHAVVTQGSAGAPFINAGASGTLSPGYEVTILPTAPSYHVVEFDLAIGTAAGYDGIETIRLTIAGPLDEDFETGGTDWTHYNVTGGFVDEWHVETYRSHSTSHSWKFGGFGPSGYSDSADGALETPPLCIGTDGEMTFWHWLSSEEESASSAWDCAFVEISTDVGESWSVLVPEGGYSHVKNDNAANPVPEGTPCWSGSFNWRQETFDLSAYEGESAVVRFRFASDALETEEGWYVDDVSVTSTSTGVAEGDVTVTPTEFALLQNRPNPFNPVTTIGYALPEQAHVTIKVYNVAGALVKTLRDERQEAGSRSVVWDGTNDGGRKVASGVYLCRMTAGAYTDSRVMVLLK